MLFQERIPTPERNAFVDVTPVVEKAIRESRVKEGVAVVFCPHTTAGVTINENADPDVAEDLRRKMAKMVPVDEGYAHAEGNSDAHVKSTLVGPTLTLIIKEGRPLLGTWQAVYFCEFDGPRDRTLFIKVQG
jgi:secondary thiamine-phosphate synthase enzyme